MLPLDFLVRLFAVHNTDGRILTLLVDLICSKFNVFCLDAPNTVSDRRLFFNRLHTFFLSPGDLILGGNFNCVDSDLDRSHIKSDFSADKCCLLALKSDFCLVDIFRKNPKAISFTWSSKDFSQASCLDHFYIFSTLLQSVHGNKCFPCPLSDHDFVNLFISPVNVNVNVSSISSDLSDLKSCVLLRDAWRALHPRVRQFTWFSSDSSVASGLDTFLVVRSLLSSVRSYVISPCISSDHEFVFIDLALKDSSKYSAVQK